MTAPYKVNIPETPRRYNSYPRSTALKYGIQPCGRAMHENNYILKRRVRLSQRI
jgi:hypothetical protein